MSVIQEMSKTLCKTIFIEKCFNWETFHEQKKYIIWVNLIVFAIPEISLFRKKIFL